MAIRLTESAVKKASPPASGQRFIFDTHRDAPRGFALRITKAGGRAFVLNYTYEGRQRRKTIGEWPTWTVVAARDAASAIKRKIDSGVDVLEEERAKRRELTVAKAVERYRDEYLSGLKSGDEVFRYFERDLLPVMGRRKLKSIKRADIRDLVRARSKDAPRAAALLLTHIKTFLAWAEDDELIEASPAAGIRPAKVNKAMQPRQRGRVLDDDEIAAFWRNESGLHRLTDIALRLVLLTGQRPGEVAGMRWSEIDDDVWTIPGTRRLKNEAAQRVPLTETALELIEQAREEVKRLAYRRRWEAGDYVFASQRDGYLSTQAIARAVTRTREAMRNKNDPDWGHWTPHDLRRTCRTRLSKCGVSEEVAERVIGHGHKGIVATYNLHQYDKEKRAALEAWERHLRAIVGEPIEAEVVSIAEARA